MCKVGQNHTYLQCIYGIFGREITKCKVMYDVYVRFWPTLHMWACGWGNTHMHAGVGV